MLVQIYRNINYFLVSILIYCRVHIDCVSPALRKYQLHLIKMDHVRLYRHSPMRTRTMNIHHDSIISQIYYSGINDHPIKTQIQPSYQLTVSAIFGRSNTILFGSLMKLLCLIQSLQLSIIHIFRTEYMHICSVILIIRSENNNLQQERQVNDTEDNKL